MVDASHTNQPGNLRMRAIVGEPQSAAINRTNAKLCIAVISYSLQSGEKMHTLHIAQRAPMFRYVSTLPPDSHKNSAGAVVSAHSIGPVTGNAHDWEHCYSCRCDTGFLICDRRTCKYRLMPATIFYRPSGFASSWHNPQKLRIIGLVLTDTQRSVPTSARRSSAGLEVPIT